MVTTCLEEDLWMDILGWVASHFKVSNDLTCKKQTDVINDLKEL